MAANRIRKPERDEKREDEEYDTLLDIFKELVGAMDDEEDDEELALLEELMSTRAMFAIRYACEGLGMTLEQGLDLLTTNRKLTEKETEQRKILWAAVDNLVDFSVAEEYQMMNEAVQKGADKDDDERFGAMLIPFAKYNRQYATVENMDIQYALIVAAALSAYRSNTVLMYMTQGDERVRPWHRVYEGFTATKANFPQWLVPPIEWGCRCFLVEDTVAGVDGGSKLGAVKAVKAFSEVPEPPEWFDPVFKESVAMGGRIFSDAHPYFRIDEEHYENLKLISERIKKRYRND